MFSGLYATLMQRTGTGRVSAGSAYSERGHAHHHCDHDRDCDTDAAGDSSGGRAAGDSGALDVVISVANSLRVLRGSI